MIRHAGADLAQRPDYLYGVKVSGAIAPPARAPEATRNTAHEFWRTDRLG